MRVFVILLFCTANLFSQDSLITKLGAKYAGTLIKITESSVRFHANGMPNAQEVSKEIISRIVLESGEILYNSKDDNNQVNISSKTDSTSRYFKAANPNQVTAEERQAKAIEKLATAHERIALLMTISFITAGALLVLTIIIAI